MVPKAVMLLQLTVFFIIIIIIFMLHSWSASSGSGPPIYSASESPAFIGPTYRWYQAAFVFLRQAHFTYSNALQLLHIVTKDRTPFLTGKQHPIVSVDNIPYIHMGKSILLYLYTASPIYIRVRASYCVCTQHPLYTYLSHFHLKPPSSEVAGSYNRSTPYCWP